MHRRIRGDHQHDALRRFAAQIVAQRQILDVQRQQRELADLVFHFLFQLRVIQRQQQHLFFLQRVVLHQPGAEADGHQARLLVGKMHAVFLFQRYQRFLRGAH